MKLVVALPLPPDPMLDVRPAAWLAALNKHPLVQLDWAQSQSCDENRNKIIAAHLDKDREMTHMFFIDGDTVPGADAVQRLMDLGMPIATGVYPMLMGGSQLAWDVRTPDGQCWWPVERPLPRTPFLTKHTGGGCLLVERGVLNAMGWPWFKRIEGDPHRAGTGPAGCGGDVYFCDKAAKTGFQIWADPNVKCSHWKKIDLLALAMRGDVFESLPEPFAGASTLDARAVEVERAIEELRTEALGSGKRGPSGLK